MSISVNYILEEEQRKKKQAQTAPIHTPQEAITQQRGGVVPQEAINRSTADYLRSFDARRQATPSPSQEPEFDYSNKPESWGDDEYRAIRQIYSDDQIQQSLAKPEPDSFLNGIFTNMVKDNLPKPVEYDEKQMKRQRAIAGIGDILGLLSQAVAGSEGAKNRERTFDQSAYGQLSKKQQELYDKYVKDTDQYSREIVNANMKDYITGMQDWKQTQENIGKSLSDYRKYQLDIAKQNQDAAYKAFNAKNTARRTEAYEKNLEAQIDDRKRRTGIAAQNAANSTARTQAYIEKLKNPTKTTTGKADYQLVIPANEGDPEAQKDQFGNSVRVFGMSTGEMDQYARQALADKEFMNRHGEFFIRTGEKYTADDKRNIAAVYLEELYGQKFTGPQMDARISSENRFSGKIPEINISEQEEVEPPFNPEIDTTELDEMFEIVY